MGLAVEDRLPVWRARIKGMLEMEWDEADLKIIKCTMEQIRMPGAKNFRHCVIREGKKLVMHFLEDWKKGPICHNRSRWMRQGMQRRYVKEAGHKDHQGHGMQLEVW